MRVGAIVQARYSSRRLPGKVLIDVGGRPLLQYLVERLNRVRGLAAVVLATSIEAEDDPVAALGERLGIAVHRGPLENVAQRFLETVDRFQLDAFVRISGDSPLLDPAIVERGLDVFRRGDADLVTNVMPRTFPPGQSVEVVRTDAFRRACKEMCEPEDLEHVTRYFYQNPDHYRLMNFASGAEYPGLHFAVDTPDQLAQVSAVLARMERPHQEYGLAEVVAIHRSLFPQPGERR